MMAPTFALSLPFAAAIGITGAIVGSFIGAATLRLPRGETIVAGRSHCDACKRTLRARELIPLVSYLGQKGRCRFCRSPIAVDQPIAEAGGVAVAVIAALSSSSMWAAVLLAVFGWTLVALALLDARHLWLPDIITLPLLSLGLIAVIAIPEVPLSQRLLGALLGYAALETVRLSYRCSRGHEGMGAGDAKLLGAIGAWLGVGALPWIILSAALLGLAVAGIHRLRHAPLSPSERLPLGTFMAIAAIGAIPVIARLIAGGGGLS